MSSEKEPSLAFISSQLGRVINDLALLRDDISVLTAIATRHETALNAMHTEMRVFHSM